MSATQTHGHAAEHHDDHGPAKGITRWLTTTNTRTSARCTWCSAW